MSRSGVRAEVLELGERGQEREGREGERERGLSGLHFYNTVYH